MTEPNITLLQPDPASLVVHYSPHNDGDAVGVQFTDPAHGRYLVAFAPETADYLSTLFATAVKSVRVGAIADQMRAAQRGRGQ
jgi:hypothetical protein